MKISPVILVSAFLILSVGCTDQDDILPDFDAQIEWIFTFGGSGDDSARAIVETEDGGFVVFGTTASTNGDITDKDLAENDYWLFKIDSEGQLLWSRTFGGSVDDVGTSMIQKDDGSFVVAGYSMSADGDASNNEGFHDNWILGINPMGNLSWERSYGFSGHDHALDVTLTADGGYYMGGFLDVTASGGAGNDGPTTEETRTASRGGLHGVGEFWGHRLDAEGNMIWRRYFGGSNNDRCYGLVETTDGGVLMTGFAESTDFDITDSRGAYDFWMVRTDANGELLWQKSAGGSGTDEAKDVAKAADESYVITGRSSSTDGDRTTSLGAADVWALRIDDEGNILWEQAYGGSDFDTAESIHLTADKGFLISGNSRSTDGDPTANNGENDMWVLKINALGALRWNKNIGGSSLDFSYDAIETSDSKIVMVGDTQSNDGDIPENKGGTDAVVVKLK